MKIIELTQGQNAYIDDEDFERVSKYKWYAVKWKNGYYAVTKVNYKGIRMHRFILGYKEGDPIVDHRDGNTLNNQKSNLRPATVQQNHFNSGPHIDNKSGFRGVYWRSNRRHWLARLMINGKKKELGSFSTKEDAAQAHMNVSFLYHKDFSWRPK